MYCKNCGAVADDEFCPSCGTRQETDGSVTPAFTYERPMRSEAKKKQALTISLIVTLLVSLLFGIFIGGVVMIILVVIYALTKNGSDTDPIVYSFLGGIGGVIIGGILAGLFAVALL